MTARKPNRLEGARTATHTGLFSDFQTSLLSAGDTGAGICTGGQSEPLMPGRRGGRRENNQETIMPRDPKLALGPEGRQGALNKGQRAELGPCTAFQRRPRFYQQGFKMTSRANT